MSKQSMSIDQVLALYDRDQRQEVDYFDVRREVTPYVTRLLPLSDLEPEGAIIHSRLDEANVDQVIQAEVAYFEELGIDLEWKVYDYDRPPDLRARLVAHGFQAEEPEAVLALDLNEAPAILWRPVTPDVRRISGPDEVQHVKEVEEAVWQEDFGQLAQRLAQHLLQDPGHLSVYVAYVGELPVSAAWIVFHEQGQFASLWGGSTRPDYRQRGLYTALVAIRAQEARRRGVRFLAVDASPMSRPILEKYGFRWLTYAHACKWPARPTQPGGVATRQQIGQRRQVG